MAAGSPSRLIERWEGIEPGKQFAIAFPILIVLIAILHWTALNQPIARGALYGLFWALPATCLIVVASQNERVKRRKAALRDDPRNDE